jgi:signal transduction histidine kinase
MKKGIRDLNWIMVSLALLIVAIVVLCVGGCAENQSETRMTMESLRDIAQSGNVQGNIKVRMSGMHEVGLKEGLYIGSEGTFIEGELEYRFAEKPTMQPVE